MSFASAYKITEKKLGKTEDAINKTTIPSEKKHFYADSRLNYSFSQLQVNAVSPTNANETKEVCPLNCMSPLSCPFGGACHTCPEKLQTKLKVNLPRDVYELEADRVADKVIHMPDSAIPPKLYSAFSRESDPLPPNYVAIGSERATFQEKREDSSLRQKSKSSSSMNEAPPIVNDVLRSPSQPLDSMTQAFFGARFGCDFSQVRVHVNELSFQSARAMNARAYTVGQDVVFGSKEYAPYAKSGQLLLAHELTHVVQQGGRMPLSRRDSSASYSPEHRAHTIAEHFVTAKQTEDPIVSSTAQPFAAVQRQESGNAIALSLSLDEEYQAALQESRRTGDWRTTAELLNRFNLRAIQDQLAQLSSDEIGYLHQGALDNLRIGPQSQIAEMTVPGAPLMSTPLPASQEPRGTTETTSATTVAACETSHSVTPAGKPIAEMSSKEKLLAAYVRARFDDAVRKQIEALITREALAVAIISFSVVFIASQFTPVGWVADLGVAVTAFFVGSVVFNAIQHLIGFAKAVDATTDEELQQAGNDLAEAIVEIGVTGAIMIATHSAGGGPKGTAPYEAPPGPAFAELVTDQGIVVRIPVENAPAIATTVPMVQSANLGLRAAAGTMSLFGGKDDGGGQRESHEPEVEESSQSAEDRRLLEKYKDRSNTNYPPSEWARIEQLELRFPQLKQAKLRPWQRPSTGEECIFEERMQTTQGKFSMAAYSTGESNPVIQFDNISPEGWIEEVKIEQTDPEDIVAQLRRLSDFAQDFGLKGVKYSIEPPDIAFEVERQVVQQQLRNVFREGF